MLRMRFCGPSLSQSGMPSSIVCTSAARSRMPGISNSLEARSMIGSIGPRMISSTLAFNARTNAITWSGERSMIACVVK